MSSIADKLQSKHTPTVYPETFHGAPIRVECPNYVLHQFTHGVCLSCNDRNWVLTKEGKALYALFLEMESAKPLFEQFQQERDKHA